MLNVSQQLRPSDSTGAYSFPPVSSALMALVGLRAVVGVRGEGSTNTPRMAWKASASVLLLFHPCHQTSAGLSS